MGLSEKLISRAKEYAYEQIDWIIHHNFRDTRGCVSLMYRGEPVYDPWMDENGINEVDPFMYYGEKKTMEFIWKILWSRDFIYEYDHREDCNRTNCKECKYTEKCNRYLLGIKGEKPLICIGVNPSTASSEVLDPTIKTIQRYLEKDDRYDGFIMLNIYPQRVTNPNKMDYSMNQEIVDRNIRCIKEVLEQYPKATIWAAWGSLIMKRPYLCECLKEIVELSVGHQWKRRGPDSKGGHPHHPLYVSNDYELEEYDINKYLEKLALVTRGNKVQKHGGKHD